MNQQIKNLILDMDGVLWHDNRPMPGLAEFFDTLRAAGIGFVLATNNATKTSDMYTAKLAGFGVTIPPEQILTSAEATATFLAERYQPGSPMFVVGALGLHEALRNQGFRIITPADVRCGETAVAVVAGLAPNMMYEDLAMAAHLINQGVPFIGTNPDLTYPSEIGPLPGAGAFLAAIHAATGVEPLIVGKPGPVIFNEAVKLLGGDPAHVAMVGDRLSTDIYGAKSAGLHAILVLSGINTREEAEVAPLQPDLIFDDITELASFLTKEISVANT